MKIKFLSQLLVAIFCLSATALLFVVVRSSHPSFTPGHELEHDALQLTGPNTTDGEGFGYCVALNDDLALVGAPWHSAANVRMSGSAYAFRLNGQTPGVQLVCQETSRSGAFGSAVALFGRTALIGKPGDHHAGEKSGAAYLFRLDPTGDWCQLARLTAGDAAPDERFGISAALEQGRALIGTQGSRHSGAVYIFDEVRPGIWRESAKLVSPKESDDHFGWPLALRGGLIAVGAHTDGGKGAQRRGAVYLFHQERAAGWQQVAKLRPSTWESEPCFGISIALDNGVIAVGAPHSNRLGGSVYVFEQDHAGNWRWVAQLASHNNSAIHFGTAVAMANGIIAVASPRERNDESAVYLFRKNEVGTWQQFTRLGFPKANAHGISSDIALAMSHDRLLVGAAGNAGATLKSGTAYLFDVANARVPRIVTANPSADVD